MVFLGGIYNLIKTKFNKKFYSILNLLYKENIILSYTLDGIYVNLYITNSLEIGKRLKLISSRHNLNTLKYLFEMHQIFQFGKTKPKSQIQSNLYKQICVNLKKSD